MPNCWSAGNGRTESGVCLFIDNSDPCCLGEKVFVYFEERGIGSEDYAVHAGLMPNPIDNYDGFFGYQHTHP